MKLGVEEWYTTDRKLEDTFPYWSKVFNSIGKIMQLAHTREENWHLIPITGSKGTDIKEPDISSLSYRNPRVREMIDAGLIVVGQLFPQDDHGRVTLTEMKPFDTLEQEWNINITRASKKLHYSSCKYNQEKIRKQRTNSNTRRNHNPRKSSKSNQARRFQGNQTYPKGRKKKIGNGERH